jgi:hypothetical protein
MWQAPNQRARALAQARRREKERAKKPMHLRRVVGQLKAANNEEAANARVLLNDLTPKGMGLFCSKPMMVGEEVSLTLEQPKQFYVKGRVVWCQEYSVDSHVLSKVSYSYRVGIEFIFDTDEDRKTVEDYCAELMKKHVFTIKAA